MENLEMVGGLIGGVCPPSISQDLSRAKRLDAQDRLQGLCLVEFLDPQ